MNTSALAISNANICSYANLYSHLNTTEYGLIRSFDGSLILNSKTPAYIFGEQLRFLADKAIDISGPVFDQLKQTVSVIDRTFTQMLPIFPVASAEKVTKASTSVFEKECAQETQKLKVQVAFDQEEFDRLSYALRENSKASGVVILSENKGLTSLFKISHHDIQSLLQNQNSNKEEVLSTVLDTATTHIKAGIYLSDDSIEKGLGFVVMPHANSPNKLLHYGLNYKIIGDRNTKQREHGEGSTIYSQQSTYFHTYHTLEEMRDCGDQAYIECIYKVHE
jgi:hypothetical protein